MDSSEKELVVSGDTIIQPAPVWVFIDRHDTDDYE